jgi:SAM-dependent methyltransferase
MLPAVDVLAYYDEHVDGKIRDFVDGNRRVEAAWRTIERWAPAAPARILEIGCGFGANAWRISRRWPSAHVVGVDISARSIEYARRVFTAPNLTFLTAPIDAIDAGGSWDVITLVDVYEHIAVADRADFNRHLERLVRPNGRIILTFPTAAYQRWSRRVMPEKMQPVDEDVSVPDIAALASDCGLELLMFQVMSIWKGGDYAHAVLGTTHVEETVPAPPVKRPSFVDRLADRWPDRFGAHGEWPLRALRLAMIERALGPGSYRPL